MLTQLPVQRGRRVSLLLGEKLQLPKSAQAAQLASHETNLNSLCASSVQYRLLRGNLESNAGSPGRISLAISKN